MGGCPAARLQMQPPCSRGPSGSHPVRLLYVGRSLLQISRAIRPVCCGYTGVRTIDESLAVLLSARTVPRARRCAQTHITGIRGLLTRRDDN